MASATLIRAPACGDMRPLMGCSPMEVAAPLQKKINSHENYKEIDPDDHLPCVEI